MIIPNAPFPDLFGCNFCFKDQNEVECLIAGPDTLHICNECVILCMDIVEKYHKEKMQSDATTSSNV